MPQATFLGQLSDDVFRAWLQNQSGFYINLESNQKGKIHKANCWHLGDGGDRRVTSYDKIVANSVAELQGWAKDNDVSLGACNHCKPE